MRNPGQGVFYELLFVMVFLFWRRAKDAVSFGWKMPPARERLRCMNCSRVSCSGSMIFIWIILIRNLCRRSMFFVSIIAGRGGCSMWRMRMPTPMWRQEI